MFFIERKICFSPANQVSKLLHVGETKVKAVRRAWKQHGVLLSRSGKGRGSVKGQGDKRLAPNAAAAAGGGAEGKRPVLNVFEDDGDVDDEETGAELSSDDDSWQSEDEVMPLAVA